MSSLLDLPKEVRDEVYKYCLAAVSTAVNCHTNTDRRNAQPEFRYAHALLSTNRQLRDEFIENLETTRAADTKTDDALILRNDLYPAMPTSFMHGVRSIHLKSTLNLLPSLRVSTLRQLSNLTIQLEPAEVLNRILPRSKRYQAWRKADLDWFVLLRAQDQAVRRTKEVRNALFTEICMLRCFLSVEVEVGRFEATVGDYEKTLRGPTLVMTAHGPGSVLMGSFRTVMRFGDAFEEYEALMEQDSESVTWEGPWGGEGCPVQ